MFCMSEEIKKSLKIIIRNRLYSFLFYLKKKKYNLGVLVAQQDKNPTGIREDAGSIPSPTQWGKDLVLLLAAV